MRRSRSQLHRLPVAATLVRATGIGASRRTTRSTSWGNSQSGPCPATGVERPLAERSRFTAWEPAQLGAFLDTADRHRLGPLYDLAAHTGLRRGEIAGLRWSDVSWERESILVAFARVQTDREVMETTPKSEAGI